MSPGPDSPESYSAGFKGPTCNKFISLTLAQEMSYKPVLLRAVASGPDGPVLAGPVIESYL